MSRAFFAVVFLLSFASASFADFVGHWEGAIEIPGTELGVKIDLALEGEAWSGTIDIPMQGAAGLPVDVLEATADSIRFSIRNVPGEPTFSGKLVDGELKGEFTQGAGKFPFTLSRDKKVAEPNRPQTPKPPFPYASEDVIYQNGEITLAGTLTIPAGEGPFPAAILITGSGPQDRDESIMGHKPFWVLADHLSRAGIAVLRVDDRGVGGSSGDNNQSISQDFAGDVTAGVEWLKKRPEIAPNRIGLIGHSEGGLVAPIVAARGVDVAFLVLLAGPGVPGDEILQLQAKLLLTASGVPEALQAKQMEAQQTTFALLRSELPEEEIRARLEALAREQIAAAGQDPEAMSAQAKAQIDHAVTPWFRYFLNYDPRPALRRVKVPVLALNGELDLQVDAEQNLPAIAAALKEGGNTAATTEALPGLNHLFQPAKTGSPEEYATIEVTMDPKVLDRIRDWITAGFKQ